MRVLTLSLIMASALAFGQKKEIIGVMKAQESAWNRGDIEGYMHGYHKGDSLMFIGRNGPTFGWQKTLENYRKSYPTPEKMGRLAFSDIRVRMLGKDYASVFGRWKLTRENDAPGGIFTLIFEKFPSGWEIISDHTQ